jgi:hypothetical protein
MFIAKLMRTAPDWAHADPLSAEVTAWLHRANEAVREIDPIEAGVMSVHAQYLRSDVGRHSTEIIETLRRVSKKLEQRG